MRRDGRFLQTWSHISVNVLHAATKDHATDGASIIKA